MSFKTREITSASSEWPSSLTEISDCPRRLYIRGKALPPGSRIVAIVGTRRPTAAGRLAARQLAAGLVQAGFTIASGLAMGIDSIAHEATLDAGGHTIAVLGCGTDLVYPQKNAVLKTRIEKCGTVLSEYPNGTESAGWRFPERNRIIAGISTATIVIEGSLKSGALITARHALDGNRHVFAVPGSIRNPMAAGPNELIRTSQALLVSEVKHVTDELAPGLIFDDASVETGRLQVALDEGEIEVLQLMDDAPVTADLVCTETGFTPGKAAISLSRLEVRGFVLRTYTGYQLTDSGARVRDAFISNADETTDVTGVTGSGEITNLSEPSDISRLPL
jgi:DNA processing protein